MVARRSVNLNNSARVMLGCGCAMSSHASGHVPPPLAMASTDAPVPAIALIFRHTPEQLRANQKAISAEYERLLKTCRDAGLVIAGKLGNGSESRGTVVLFVDCTDDIRRQAIVSWERYVYKITR